jgi:hypothetical protein
MSFQATFNSPSSMKYPLDLKLFLYVIIDVGWDLKLLQKLVSSMWLGPELSPGANREGRTQSLEMRDEMEQPILRGKLKLPQCLGSY